MQADRYLGGLGHALTKDLNLEVALCCVYCDGHVVAF